MNKNSVFYEIFSKPDTMLALYKELHPEDAEVSENDLEIASVTNGPITDLVIIGRNKIMVFFEAHSSKISNVPCRMLQITAHFYRSYTEKNNLKLTGVAHYKMPTPEFYVLDPTNEMRADFSLSDDLRENTSFIQLKVKVLSRKIVDNLPCLSSYFDFVRILDLRYCTYKSTYQLISESLMMKNEANVVDKFLFKKTKELEEAVMVRFFVQGIYKSARDLASDLAIEETTKILHSLNLDDEIIAEKIQELNKY